MAKNEQNIYQTSYLKKDKLSKILSFFQSLGVFGLCQIVSFIDYLRANMSKENFNVLFKTLSMGVAGIVGIGLAAMTLSGEIKFKMNLKSLN